MNVNENNTFQHLYLSTSVVHGRFFNRENKTHYSVIYEGYSILHVRNFV